jgi:hypothetical protein
MELLTQKILLQNLVKESGGYVNQNMNIKQSSIIGLVIIVAVHIVLAIEKNELS